MAKTPTLLNVASQLYKLLEPLDAADRGRAIASAQALLGDPVTPAKPPAVNGNGHSTGGGGDLSGIAHLTSSGELKITARDLKAKSTNDAAIRLAHIAVYANEKLSKSPGLSASKGLNPILKTWRTYTGNTRQALADQKGIIREGDTVSLDEHAKRQAEEFIRQIQDPSIEGSWKPGTAKKRAGKSAKKKQKA